MKIIQTKRGISILVDDDDYTRFGHLKWSADLYPLQKAFSKHKEVVGDG